MNKTTIDYLTHTWNPIAMRCTPVSEGCKYCWHLAMCKRIEGNRKVSRERRFGAAGGDPVLLTDELGAPLRRRAPSRIGVQFMGDLVHEAVRYEDIHAVFSVMYVCRPCFGNPAHEFLVLTKRPDRLCRFVDYRLAQAGVWPGGYPHVWLGVTCENQQTILERVLQLLACPAAVRWVSCEPLLEAVVFSPAMLAGLHWVVAGCESGPKRRPANLKWFRSLRDQCRAAGVPFFLKQIAVNGKVSHNPTEWPADLCVREYPRVDAN